VPVGARQNKFAFVERGNTRINKRHDCERNTALRERSFERARIRRVRAEPQQDEPAAEQIERGAPVRQPGMGARAPGRVVGRYSEMECSGSGMPSDNMTGDGS
jgi:hypothetical protein